MWGMSSSSAIARATGVGSRPHCWRPKPNDFRERYIEMGWEWIVEHYRTNWKVVARWIDEEGREELKAARAAHVEEHGRNYLHPRIVRRQQR